MAYLKQFEHDVFVSYAHVDNLPDREGEKGWVERFERQLSVRLLKRFGEPVDVWRDPELSRAQLFDKVIEKAVRGAGIMVSLISSRYLKSDYCGQEIDWFCEKAKAESSGLVVDDYLRVFPVLLYNIPPDNWPEACKGPLAFAFHDAEGDAFGKPLDPDSEAFEKQLRRLVEELHAVLTKLQAKEAEAQAAPAEDATDQEPSFTVFMASSAEDMGPTHRQLVKALRVEGINVIANMPPPYDEEEHAEAVQEALKKADLSIHLLSTRAGEPLYEETPEKTFPLEQARLALEDECAKLILLPEELHDEDIAEAAYATFIRDLRTRPRDAGLLELVQTSRHQMLDEILAKRRKLEEEARRLQEQAAGAGTTAFIDLHVNDVVYVTHLIGYLVEKKITPMMIPSADLSPTAGMSLFEDHIKKASLYIIVYGSVARNWVENRLNEAIKLILSHSLPTHIGVYVSPPHKEPSAVTFPPLFDVANNMDGFEPGTLDGLLQKTAVA